MRRLVRKLSKSEFARNVSALTSGNLVGQIIAFAALPWLTRMYGPAAFGFLAIYMSISTVVSVISTGRYEYAIPLPESRREALTIRVVTRGMVWITVLIALILVGVAKGPIAELLQIPDNENWLFTIPVHIALLGELSILSNWLTREKRFRAQSLNKVVFNSAMVVSQFALGLLGWPDFRGLVAGLLIAQFCSWLYLTSRLRDMKVGQLSRRELIDTMDRYKKMPLLNAPTAVLDGLRVNGINAVIGNASLAVLGQFSLAWRVVQVPSGLIGAALAQVYFHRMARESRGRLEGVVRSSLFAILLFSFPVFLFLFFVLPSFVPLVLGSEWGDAGLFAQALTPWLYLNLATSPIATVFVVAEAQGRQMLFAILYTVNAVGTLLLFRENLLVAVWVFSISMSFCLILFVVMAIYTARQYDLRTGSPSVS